MIMVKITVLSLTIFIFALSFFYGKSLNRDIPKIGEDENITKDIKDINRVMKKRNLLTVNKEDLKKEISQEKAKTKMAEIKKQARYKNIAEIAGMKSTDNPLINAIVALENAEVVDHESFVELNDQLKEYTENFPEESFNQISNILGSSIAETDHALRGNLMVAASFIDGKEDEVKAIAISELETNIIKVEKPSAAGAVPKGDEVTKGAIAVVLAYESYLNASHKDLRNIDDETIEILKIQSNREVRFQIASSFDRAFPSKREEMLKRLEEEGIKLIPEGNEVSMEGN